ncbi:MAG: hypothetical protein M0Z85_00040 [Gammaproteobacteria bacterium]|nr:hypothetical protein [Gammaproteobacteria bacterium]
MGLTTGFITETLKYLPALLPDVAGNASTVPIQVAGAPKALFQYSHLRQRRLVTLRGLQHLDTAGISLTVQADNYQSKSIDNSAAALWSAFNPTAGAVWDTSAWDSLQVNAQNTTADVINYWAAANVLIEAPTLARMAKYPGTVTLTGRQLAEVQKLGIDGRGVLPRDFEWIRLNEYQNQIVAAVPLSTTLPVGVAPVTFAQDNAKGNEMLVIAGVAVSAGTGTDALTITFTLDDGDVVLSYPAYALGSGHPVPMFLQAAQNVQVTMTANTSETGIQCSVLVWHVRLTDEIQVRLGNVTSGRVYQKVMSGVV